MKKQSPLLGSGLYNARMTCLFCLGAELIVKAGTGPALLPFSGVSGPCPYSCNDAADALPCPNQQKGLAVQHVMGLLDDAKDSGVVSGVRDGERQLSGCRHRGSSFAHERERRQSDGHKTAPPLRGKSMASVAYPMLLP